MVTKLPIFASRHFDDFGENLKTNFPKRFFREIWLKIGAYKFIYITEKNRNF